MIITEEKISNKQEVIVTTKGRKRLNNNELLRHMCKCSRTDVSSFVANCLVFSLASVSLDEKVTKSIDLKMNPLEEGRGDVIVTD